MAFNMDLVGACENIRREAEQLAGQNYAFNLQRKTGALDFITSPENGGTDSELITWDAGKKVGTLLVHYDQRTKPCEIVHTSGADICDAGSQPERKSFTTQITDYIRTPVRQFANEDMVVLCQGTDQFVMRRLMNDLRAAREALSEKVLANIDGFSGINYEFDGTTTAAGASKSIDLIDTSGSQAVPLPGNFADVMLDYQNNQLMGMPALIGQGLLEKYYLLNKMSCCNSTTPYGEATIDGDARFYKDQASNAILGANEFLMVAPGIVKMVTFNENKNIGITSPTNMHITIPDPAGYPFEWNLDFKFDECTKTWKYMYSLHYKIFNVYQADSFASSGASATPDISPDCEDELAGMTGVFKYTAS